MRMIIKSTLTLWVFACFASIAFSAEIPNRDEKINALFAEWDNANAPGCAVVFFQTVI